MRKTMSIILMSAIIGSTVVSTPVSLFANDSKPSTEKTEAQKKAEEEKKKAEEEKKKAEEQEKKEKEDAGKTYGEKLGEERGKILGKKDAIDEAEFNWEKRYKGLGNITPPFSTDGSNEYLKGFYAGFKEKFEKAYVEAYIETNKDKYNPSVIESIAEETGEKDAISDFYNKLPIDSKRRMLSDEEIIKKFDLDLENPAYIEVFVVLYKTKYVDKYNDKYRELRKDNFDIDAEGYEQGKKIGEKQGEFSGKIDFVTPGAPNNWEGSFKKFENQKNLVERYFLDRESQQYKESFITGFKEAYRIAYDKTYKASNVATAENNINYVKIAAIGGKLEFKPSDGVGSLGGTLTIENATITQETHLGISMDRDSFNYKNLKYKPVNHVYNVAVDNANGFIELEKPMKLALEHYSTDELSGRAGIYQLVNNEWRYIHTDQKEVGVLEAEIPEGKFRGGKYAIFIDTDYKPIQDIKGHWASEELYTFLRRGYIEGYEKNGRTEYYPNTTMKRGHFVELLGKVLGWDYGSTPDNTSKFTDGKYFGERRDAINYAANMGYINGYPDGSFKPDNTLTYQQIEWILRSVMFDNQFKWDTYQQDIIKNKHTQPASVKDKKQPIKRGEVVYMLHEIQKKNLM